MCTSKNDYMHVFRRPLAVASVPRAAQIIPGVLVWRSALAAASASQINPAQHRRTARGGPGLDRCISYDDC
jgi:hypothetical protein